MTGNKIAVDPARLFCEPLDEAGPVNDLGNCFGERLSLFKRQDAAEVILVFDDQFIPCAKHARTVLGGPGRPRPLRHARRSDRRARLARTERGHTTDDFAGRRIVNGEARIAPDVDPIAADVRSLTEQAAILHGHALAPGGTLRGDRAHKKRDTGFSTAALNAPSHRAPTAPSTAR